MPEQTDTAPAVETLADLVTPQQGSVVSRMLLKKKAGSVTLFAFAAGEGLSEHTTPYEALVYIVDGEAEIDVADQTYHVAAGETITLPADVPHAVRAVQDFKMLLVMIRSS